MDYKKIADEVSEKILSYNQDTSGWRVIKISKNVTVSSKPSKEYAGNIYRGEGIIKEVPSKIIPFMYLPEYRNKWDKALQSYKLLERIDQDTGIYHSVTHSYGMGLISSRDFVDLLHVKPYPGDILTTNSVSVEYSSCPPTPSCVRGYNNPCGYVCSPLPENPEHSKLVVFIQPELGGMLPSSVVETALPTTLINLITETRAGLKGLKDHD
ncbi:stAR-related lipid transfer protein 6 [Accipiter gentilis]|uniref:stAR-related lipid transfer protein 6 n=1 Tax=Astur gentilis TaxID=8957 RepID=UPI002110CFE5|nr:stAR-related lipid transfer protein 6 [Accipiter gentilis]XP_049650255.1 stAR-related lipid transfer protein 6 [Accipiter gentilis]